MLDIAKASRMRSMCVRCNLFVLHNCKPTYLDVSHGSLSLLDIWLVSDPSFMIYSGQVQCPAISHHALILAAFQIVVRCSYKYFEYRDFSRTNWEGIFSSISSFDSDSFYGSGNVEIQSSLINSLILSLYEYVPVVKRRVRIDDSSWMKSNEIVLATSLRDLAYSTFRSSGSSESWRIYCRYRNKAKNVIRKVRKRFYSKLFSGLNISSMWRVLKGSGVTNDNEFTSDCDVNEVNSYFVNVSDFNNDVIDFDSFNYADESFSFSCVNEFEIFNALCKIKSKCVGTDFIPIRFIETIYPHISHFLVHHINFILTSSTFPSIWKTARVVPYP